MWQNVELVRTDVSEERIASIIRVTRIGELRTALALAASSSTVFGISCQMYHSIMAIHAEYFVTMFCLQ
jgi:hypothetical protein